MVPDFGQDPMDIKYFTGSEGMYTSKSLSSITMKEAPSSLDLFLKINYQKTLLYEGFVILDKTQWT